MKQRVMYLCKWVVGFCVIAIIIGQQSISTACTLLYESVNLAGHTVSPECFPVTCPDPQPECDNVGITDVGITSVADYGTVISNTNPPEQGVFVNAIGHKKFIETFPNGRPISLGIYKYTGAFKLLTMPDDNPYQVQNPETVQLMIQLYDGRNALWPANKNTVEGTIYWDLNPWDTQEPIGIIKFYTNTESDPIPVSPQMVLPPDVNVWHKFELIVDLAAQKYVSMTIDTMTRDLSTYGLYQRTHANWGNEVALNITTESEAANPQYYAGCWTFQWETAFQNLKFFACDSYLLWTK